MSRLIVSLCLLIAGCATVSQIENAPLEDGVWEFFSADRSKVVRAARMALMETGFALDKTYQTPEGHTVFISKKSASAWSSGELVRIVVFGGDSTTATVNPCEDHIYLHMKSQNPDKFNEVERETFERRDAACAAFKSGPSDRIGVAIKTRRRVATNFAAKGDYSDNIFSSMRLTLAQ